MDEALNLGLHAPVTKLYLAELVGTHDGGLPWVVIVLFNPVVLQWTPLGLDRLVESRVLFDLVLMRRDGIRHNINRVCKGYSHCLRVNALHNLMS